MELIVSDYGLRDDDTIQMVGLSISDEFRVVSIQFHLKHASWVTQLVLMSEGTKEMLVTLIF